MTAGTQCPKSHSAIRGIGSTVLSAAHGWLRTIGRGIAYSLLLADVAGSLQAQITTVPTGTTPYAVAVNPITSAVYISNQGSNTVSVWDGKNALTIPVGGQPSAIAINR